MARATDDAATVRGTLRYGPPERMGPGSGQLRVRSSQAFRHEAARNGTTQVMIRATAPEGLEVAKTCPRESAHSQAWSALRASLYGPLMARLLQILLHLGRCGPRRFRRVLVEWASDWKCGSHRAGDSSGRSHMRLHGPPVPFRARSA